MGEQQNMWVPRHSAAAAAAAALLLLATRAAAAPPPFVTSLTLGVDYYPEAWPQQMWAADAAAMQAAGITMVRVAEFAWHVMQPSADAAFNFSLFDAALDVLSAHGIRAVFGTPTAAPPAWLVASAPDMQLETAAGTPVRFGSRQNMDHLHPLFVAATRAVVTAIAAHYADDARVAAFQIDNEIHGEDDFGPLAVEAFRQWLAAKYGNDVEALNVAWGTVFWGHTYDAFEEVPAAWAVLGGTQPAGSHNPSLALDFKRFIADVGADFLELQAGILRALAPAKPLTHNCMGTYDRVDYSRFGDSLDVVAFDNYPFSWWSGSVPPDFTQADEGRIYSTALQAALMRAAGARRPFYVMEEQASNTGQELLYGSGTVELYRLGAWQMVANGADGVQFFRWRTTRVGAEQHWEGVLNYDGNTNTRRYRGVARLGAEFARASAAVFGRPFAARVAVIYSVESRWAFTEQPLTTIPFDVLPQMEALLGAFRANRIGVDALFVPADVGAGPPALPPSFNLSAYDIVVAPSLIIVPDNVAAALAAFVARGGALLATMRSGAKTADNAYVATPLPGALAGAAMAGVTMDEWDPLCSLGATGLRAAANASLLFAVPAGAQAAAMGGFICEVLVPAPGTQVLATYAGGYHDGRPAVTRRGRVFYAGAVSADGAFYEWLAAQLAAAAGLPFGPRLPLGVELAQRGTTVLAMNWNGRNVSLTVPAAARGTDVLSGAAINAAGDIALGPYGVVVAVPP